MSPQDIENELHDNGSAERNNRENDSVANKLSKELSNWRQRRTGGRGRQHHKEGPSVSFKSDAARTIKVRGHETLVIRKPKIAAKTPATTEPSDS
ncbi:MAG TPA: hypothetical protein VMT61_09270 [Candidatus Binataceae bacterium]|nr:hypothetical protein [Candidatus Binataceae bacterium]